jgi:hypothetical protein
MLLCDPTLDPRQFSHNVVERDAKRAQALRTKAKHFKDTPYRPSSGMGETLETENWSIGCVFVMP